MRKVAIHFGGKTGFVAYDHVNKEVMITHPNENVRRVVHDYLANPHDFVVSDSPPGCVGGRKKETATPTESPQRMAMSLCELHANTGVHVNWDHPDNRFSQDDNTTANKPILKSIFGTGDFEIIN